jgi:hypothetical protein
LRAFILFTHEARLGPRLRRHPTGWCHSRRASGREEQCIAASDQGQDARDNGNYRRARDAFAACARAACPALVRRDCAQWQAELEETWPSVIVSAKDERGDDLIDVRVFVDGDPLVTKLDGRPARVDPGEHKLRIEADGRPPVEQHLVVRAGEKNRVIEVRMGSTGEAAGGQAEHGAPPRESGSAPDAKRTSALVFGGLALVAFGTEAYFGLSGLSDRSTLLSQPCAQTGTCSTSTVDSIRTKFTVADIALGVGLASGALAVYLFLSSSPAKSNGTTTQGAHVDLAPLPGGGAATLSGRF